MKQPKVSIVILNWNGYDDTIECIESLKKITYPNYEVIDAENGSSGDDIRILKKEYEDYMHVMANDKSYGYPGGNNIGMRCAFGKGTDYMLLLNNGAVVGPDPLTKLVKECQSGSSVGVVGAKRCQSCFLTELYGSGCLPYVYSDFLYYCWGLLMLFWTFGTF